MHFINYILSAFLVIVVLLALAMEWQNAKHARLTCERDAAQTRNDRLRQENKALVCAMRLRVVKVGYIEDQTDGVRIVGWIFRDEAGNHYDEHAAHIHFLWGYTADDLREIAARPAEFIESS